MTFSITFSVDINPTPKGRPKFARRGNFVRAYTPKKTADYETEIKTQAQAMMNREPLETPLAVYLYFRLPVPRSHSKKRREACLNGSERPIKKPDLDNLAKAVLDGLNGVVWRDDSQIVSLHITKVYNSNPGIDLMIREELN